MPRQAKRYRSRSRVPMQIDAKPVVRRLQPRKLSQGQVYNFKRTVQLTPYSGATPFTTNIVRNDSSLGQGIVKCALSDLNGYTDFTNLFEQFKMTAIKLSFYPYIGDSANVSTTGSGAGNMSPLAYAVNRSNSTTNPTFAQLMEDQDVKVVSSQKPFSVWINAPKFYAPADGLTIAQEKTGWLSSTDQGFNVHHYGLRFAFDQIQTTAQVGFRVFATYYLSCKNPN